MSTGNQWEVVRKHLKKAKPNASGNNNKPSRNEVREFLDKMPKMDECAPIKEAGTIFDALLIKPKQTSENKNKTSKNGLPPKQNTTSHQGIKTKKKQLVKKKEQVKPPKSLEEALQNVNTNELRSVMAMVKLRFPESPNIWLKDMVAYLNIKLNVDVDPTYSGKGSMFPMSEIPDDLRDIMNDTLKACSTSVLKLFFERWITEIEEDMVKGLKTHGYRILLQMIALRAPQMVVEDLPKYVALRNSNQSKPNICLSILWVVGQVGLSDFQGGLKVWLDVMLPVLCMKAYSKYTVDYITSLFKCYRKPFIHEKIMDVHDFFLVFDIIFNNSACLATNFHSSLVIIYPKIKVLAFGSNPELSMRNFFPSFLRRLLPSCSPSLKDELLLCLLKCLMNDVHCYGIWHQMYTRHYIQSRILLGHIYGNWENVRPSLAATSFKGALKSFIATNDELNIQKSKSIPEELSDCDVLCKNLIAKMDSTSTFLWRNIVFFLVTLISGLVIFDCQLHGSFKASKTNHFLDDVGLLTTCECAWSHSKHYAYHAYIWLEKNIPLYYGVIQKFCGPYLKFFLNWMSLVGKEILQFFGYSRNFVVKNGPVFLEWIDSWISKFFIIVGTNGSELLQVVLNGLSIVWAFMSSWIVAVGTWLQQNVFTGELAVEKLQHHVYSAVDLMKVYAKNSFQWITQQINSK